jgi:RNA polymerase sigma factor (sigma-70 family)
MVETNRLSMVMDAPRAAGMAEIGFPARIAVDVRGEDDAELVRLAGKGHQEAWSELVRRFDGLVQRVAKRQGLNDNDAADAAQLTWLRLMGHLDQLRDPARIGGWLATTARRESVRVALRQARQVPSADPLSEYGTADVSPPADAGHFRAQFDPEIERAVAALPTPYQRLLRLLISEAGPSYAEIARALAIPIGSVGPMRQRALQRLRHHPDLRTHR